VTRRLLVVLGLPLLVGACAAIPTAIAFGSRQAGFAAIAFGLCVPPGLAVLLLHDYLIRTTPFGRVVALFAGTFLRLALGFGGGILAYFAMGLEERADKLAYFLWILFAYLTVLVVETVMFAKPATGARQPGLPR
jgi:hypothetical protein